MDTTSNAGDRQAGNLISFDGMPQWALEATGGIESNLVEEDHEPAILHMEISGQGQLLISPPEPIVVADHFDAIQLWIYIDTLPSSAATLSLIFDNGEESHLGQIEVSNWNYLHKCIHFPKDRVISAIALRGSFAETPQKLLLKELGFLTASPLEALASSEPLSVLGSRSMLPKCDEDTETFIIKEGISFIFESRSLSTVVRFVYTPIEGNLSDIELEINTGDALNPALEGGISIEMGGKEWSPEDENIERHFVSCEQVNDCVEARWQWKLGDELADFLYRIRLKNKSLIIELEGGNGKATGINLGQVSGALHPHLIDVPYFSLGDTHPRILCTAGVFLSSFVDAYRSQASHLNGPPDNSKNEVRLNGGTAYNTSTQNKRNALQETLYITVSRAFEETLPSIAIPDPPLPRPELLKNRLGFLFSDLAASEETYVELYEQLLSFKQWGIDQLIIHHSSDTWQDPNNTSGFTHAGSVAKGGDDALSEYLEALEDLEYPYSLSSNYTRISPNTDLWDIRQIARDQNNELISSGPGHFRIKTSYALSAGPAHAQKTSEKYSNQIQRIDEHASTAPWTRLDADHTLPVPASYQTVLNDDQQLLWQLAQQRPTVPEGGSHWMFTGLAHGFFARLAGSEPIRMPWLVDFDLRYMHPHQTDSGMGTIDQYVGKEISEAERQSRSPHMDRYLAATLAFGHIPILPDPTRWGLASTFKTYYMLLPLQNYYIGVSVDRIRYHHEGNLLETSEALLSGAYLHSQVEITYANGFQVFANGSWDLDWELTLGEKTYRIPPAGFIAYSSDGVLVYSADDGQGRIDYARCPDYLYFDTHGRTRDMGALTTSGTALITNKNWEIDIYPVDIDGPLEILPSFYWEERRLPKLRVLAFKPEVESPENLKSDMVDNKVSIQPIEGVYKYRITLPEWMVEPSR